MQCQGERAFEGAESPRAEIDRFKVKVIGRVTATSNCINAAQVGTEEFRTEQRIIAQGSGGALNIMSSSSSEHLVVVFINFKRKMPSANVLLSSRVDIFR